MPDPEPFRGLSDALLGLVVQGSSGRRYPLRERMREDAQGWVFRAASSASVDVAVKVLRPASPEAFARFQHEAVVLQRLSRHASPNPNLVRLFNHGYARVPVAATGQTWDVAFSVQELLEAETLDQAITRARPRGLGLDRARRVLRHMVLALQDTHAQGVLHRDLSPSRVLLTIEDGREIAKVTDFGLTKLVEPPPSPSPATPGASSAPTPAYAPPELFESGDARVGPQTDVFALAAIFHELVTGAPALLMAPGALPHAALLDVLRQQRPALGRVPQALPPELSQRPEVVTAVDAELARALSPEPSERHATVDELGQAVERALTLLSAAGQAPGVDQEVSMAATWEASSTDPVRQIGSSLPAVPGVRVSTAPVLHWRRVTDVLAPGAYRAIAVSASGGRAVGLGPRGPALWSYGRWSRLLVPTGVAADSLQTVVWAGERIVLAGSQPEVFLLDERAAPQPWPVGAPGVTFRAVGADDQCIVLAGERLTSARAQGVVATIPLLAGPGAPWKRVDVAGCGPLLGATRVRDTIMACGEAGALVSVDAAGQARIVRACEPALHAILALPDGHAAAVGKGGFAFRVTPALHCTLEAVQTQRDLCTLAVGPDGVAWCAGAAGRVLRRDTTGWSRIGETGTDARVCALHVGPERVIAFCEDGGVVEGVAS